MRRDGRSGQHGLCLAMLAAVVRTVAGFASATAPGGLSRRSVQWHHGSHRARQQRRPASSLGAVLILPRTAGRPIESIAAPMVAASDYAFRCLCRRHGVDLAFTQMLHAENLVHHDSFRRNHLDLWEYTPMPPSLTREQEELLHGAGAAPLRQLPTHDGASSGPVVVQLAGHDPGTVVEAARVVLEETRGQVHGFDLNLGCPQGIARKGRYGAFLMEQDPALACRILAALRAALPADVCVSAKIRLPLDAGLLPETLSRLLDTGLDFLTIHGRTRLENKVNVGACHLDEIARAVALVEARTPGLPVVANGGVERGEDAARIQRLTGAAAVMSSEGLLEDPGLFRADAPAGLAAGPRPALERQFRFARDYLALCRRYPPLPGVLGQSSNIVRGHLFKFLFRYLSEHPDLRDRLASYRTRRLEDFERVCQELYARYENVSDPELVTLASSRPDASWYRRHWAAQGAARSESLLAPSVPERKEAARLRIATLRKEKQERQATAGLWN